MRRRVHYWSSDYNHPGLFGIPTHPRWWPSWAFDLDLSVCVLLAWAVEAVVIWLVVR